MRLSSPFISYSRRDRELIQPLYTAQKKGKLWKHISFQLGINLPLVPSPLRCCQTVCWGSLRLLELTRKRRKEVIHRATNGAGSTSNTAIKHTNKLLDGDPIENIEGCVQFQRLGAALTHKAHLHGGARRFGALHRWLKTKNKLISKTTFHFKLTTISSCRNASTSDEG